MAIWFPTFISTALQKCWQLGPIMASQHNECCHKITSFPIQKIFWHSKNGSSKLLMSAEIMSMPRDIKLKETKSLCEKRSNIEFFLVHIFLYSNWIRRITEIYDLNLCIQSEYRKIRTTKNYVFGNFLLSR